MRNQNEVFNKEDVNINMVEYKKRISNIDLAKFIGILIGDGCLSYCSKKGFIVVTCNIFDDQEFFNLVVIPILEKLRGRKVHYRKRPKYGKIEINFPDANLFSYIKSFGFPIGKKKNIKIPNFFLRSKLENYVVAGIFATDGSLVITNNNGILYPRVEFRSISIPLLQQIKDILEKNGMRGGLYKKFTRLQFNGKHNLEIFINKIGFLNPKHHRKYKKWLSHPKHVGVAQPGRALEIGETHKFL